tara:strand:- start:86 stop:418 length:333 start_codon:yes stop_codon:yes gene_type:complete
MEIKFSELKKRRPLLHLILEYDDRFKIEENVIHLEDVFFINSLVEWCMTRKEAGVISHEKFKTYMLLLEKYMKKEIDLFWEDDILHVKRIKQHNQGEENASDNLESFEQE